MRGSRIVLWAVCAILMTACNQKDLCFDHWDHEGDTNVKADINWDLVWEVPFEEQTDWLAVWDRYDFGITYASLNPARPAGVCAVVYSQATGRQTIWNMLAGGGVINMSEGKNSILMYNNDTQYIVFRDLDKQLAATASTRSRSRSTYLGSPVLKDGDTFVKDNDKENTLSCPDALFGHYIEDYTAVKTQQTPVLSVMMRPLVYTYLVRYKFEYGLKYVALARGALAGMAGSVYLTDGHTGDDVATFLYDAQLTAWGAQAEVRTFGVPGFPNSYYTRADGGYGLNLEVRLKNGKIFNFDFDVTDQVRRQPHGGVIEVGGVVITDEMGKTESGSFDVTVEDWGPHEDVYLNFSNPK